MTAISPARRARSSTHFVGARCRSTASTCSRSGSSGSRRRSTTSSTGRCRRGRVQGRPRRVRQRQDVLRPLARRARAAAWVRDERGADLRDRDAAAPARDRLPAAGRAALDRRAGRRRASRASSTAGSTRSSEDVLAEGTVGRATTRAACWPRTNELLEQRLGDVEPDARRRSPRRCAATGRRSPHGRPRRRRGPARVARRPAARRGARQARRRDQGRHRPRRALGFLQGLLVVLRDSGYAGLVLVLDEVETLQRVRGDVREQGAQRAAAADRRGRRRPLPGLYLVITGTPAFFDGPQGVQRLPPLAQRLAHRLPTDARFDNPRAVQIRLPGSTLRALVEVGSPGPRPLRGRHADARSHARRWSTTPTSRDLAQAVTGHLGGKVGVAPRCSSRSSSPTSSTASTSSPTSTRASTTRSPCPTAS